MKDNPDVMAARLYLGESDLGLKDYDAAAAEFQGVLKKMPTLWSAHHGLAMAYAGKGDWAGFDRERSLNEAAQATNGSGVPNYGFDRIDHWKIGNEDYEVRYFPRLSGQSGVRYAFLHTAKDGKIDRWMQLDSSEADQKAYKEKHPKEAEAGGRAYSLNTYSVDAQGMTQALVRPYPDGEPNYQALRTDVIEALTKPSDKK